MRATTIALLALLLGLAGCLQGSQPLDEASSAEPPNASSSAPPSDASDGERQAGGQEAVNGTETDPEQPVDGNETDEGERGDPSPRLPANLSMEGADVVEAEAERVVFRWRASTPTGVAGLAGPDGNTRETTFDVPADRWIEVNATVTGQDTEADLEVELADGDTRWCGSEGWPVPSDEARASCEVRPHPRPGWERWTVLVHGENPGEAGAQEAEFVVELTIELVEGPWEDPRPSRAPHEGWPDPERAEIRPGANLFESGCTINFIFRGPANQTLYAGTAAHCVDGWGLGAPLPLAAIPGAGRLAYCSWGTMGAGGLAACPLDEDPRATEEQDNDFALIEIDPALRHLVHPGLKYWGGPTALAQVVTSGDRVLTYGNSTLRDGGQRAPDPLDPREGFACQVDEWMSYVVLAGPGIPGDSGSPLLTGEGRAMGVMRSLGGTVCPGVVENGVANLPRMLAFLEDNTDLRVRLATWPLEEQPILPSGRPT